MNPEADCPQGSGACTYTDYKMVNGKLTLVCSKCGQPR